MTDLVNNNNEKQIKITPKTEHPVTEPKLLAELVETDRHGDVPA